MSEGSSEALVTDAGARDRLIAGAVSVLYKLLVYSTILFLMAPLVIVVVISFQEQGYGGWPPESWSLDWYLLLPQRVESLGLVQALGISLQVALSTVVVTVLVGGLAAFAIARYDFKYSTSLETLLLSPLIYPWLVTGFAILLVIGRLNTVYGLGIRMSFWTLLAGHVIVILPYPTRTILASLQNFDHTLEEAAQDLFATELTTYTKITLPLIKPGLVSGAIFAFILSFNQYIVSLFLSGSNTQTVPLRLFNLFYDSPPQQLAALGTVLMCSILVVVLLAERGFGISEYM
ncbi:ABC transporter permease [Salinirubellus sp. GCM10025818]|uniref:ABC transporter permease n=1 Tax=Salinirubellus TaxID=2162630 RepID=UPI0030CA832D